MSWSGETGGGSRRSTSSTDARRSTIGASLAVVASSSSSSSPGSPSLSLSSSSLSSCSNGLQLAFSPLSFTSTSSPALRCNICLAISNVANNNHSKRVGEQSHSKKKKIHQRRRHRTMPLTWKRHAKCDFRRLKHFDAITAIGVDLIERQQLLALRFVEPLNELDCGALLGIDRLLSLLLVFFVVVVVAAVVAVTVVVVCIACVCRLLLALVGLEFGDDFRKLAEIERAQPRLELLCDRHNKNTNDDRYSTRQATINTLPTTTGSLVSGGYLNCGSA
jgi:hypothetical protein